MSASVKLVLQGSTLSTFSTNAEGCVTYYIDFEGSGTVPADPKILSAALLQCPQIGTQKDFPVVLGAPGAVHQLRVSNLRTRESITANAYKHFVDVIYTSRPRASVEYGSSVQQVPTNTSLMANAKGRREQMVLNWTADAGAWGTLGGTQIPSTSISFPRVPVNASRMQFGASFRLSATYYADEISERNLNSIVNFYSDTINSKPVIDPNDSRDWLITSIGINSVDQFEFRVTGEWIFSPFGWDTIAVYSDPFSKQLAVIKQDQLDKVYGGLSTTTAIPNPINTDASGIGRWPQNFAINHLPLIAFFRQNDQIPTLVKNVLNF